tara:strand:- start:408 stop:890 length:483 start_codon:yes stop_codon:yes gene_type:complete
MHEIKSNLFLKIIFILSFSALLIAYFIEIFLGHQPCNLCLIERIPYGLSLILIIMYFVFSKYQKFLILLLIINFLMLSAISIYHVGIEQGFFEESFLCSIKDETEILSKDELLLKLQENITSCKDVTFKIFGFSLTSINVLISLIISILLTKIYIYEKKS